MLFLLYDDTSCCPHQHAGFELARAAGLRGFSLATLSSRLGCERLIGMVLR